MKVEKDEDALDVTFFFEERGCEISMSNELHLLSFPSLYAHSGRSVGKKDHELSDLRSVFFFMKCPTNGSALDCCLNQDIAFVSVNPGIMTVRMSRSCFFRGRLPFEKLCARRSLDGLVPRADSDCWVSLALVVCTRRALCVKKEDVSSSSEPACVESLILSCKPCWSYARELLVGVYSDRLLWWDRFAYVAMEGMPGGSSAGLSMGRLEERAMAAMRVVNLRVSYQVDVRRRESEEFYTRHQDAPDDRATVRAEIEVLRRERLAYEREYSETRQALAV
ncbi:hypothetical protein Tco_0940929 [Tanacetum coccineum]|uniref:Uncharacterized protein n=1 Tax=Tanacetum coccineum TaxID=301880 RepID=A0ABQ5DW17_9ASTR